MKEHEEEQRSEGDLIISDLEHDNNRKAEHHLQSKDEDD